MSRLIGQQAEEEAVEYLQKKGYTILVRNYTIRGGEIDIIAIDTNSCKEEYIVFIEVKYRQNSHYGYAREFVDDSKKKHMTKTAIHYLAHNPCYQEMAARFDVIEFQGDFSCVEHIENAFDIST